MEEITTYFFYERNFGVNYGKDWFTSEIQAKAKSLKIGSVFLKEEKNCYKMVYYTLYLSSVNCQKSRWKVRIYGDEKPTFLNEAWQM